jgi:hypothetical protein
MVRWNSWLPVHWTRKEKLINNIRCITTRVLTCRVVLRIWICKCKYVTRMRMRTWATSDLMDMKCWVINWDPRSVLEWIPRWQPQKCCFFTLPTRLLAWTDVFAYSQWEDFKCNANFVTNWVTFFLPTGGKVLLSVVQFLARVPAPSPSLLVFVCSEYACCKLFWVLMHFAIVAVASYS